MTPAPAAKPATLAAIALLVLAPLAALFALDRALVTSTSMWSWLATELPRRVDDSCRVEALLRTLPRGRENVVVLGNSRADDALDLAELERRFAAQSLRFHNLTVAGSGVVEYAMRARRITELEPRAAILMLHPSALRAAGWSDETYAYDPVAAASVFTKAEILESLGFHLDGLASQAHVLARHRSALQSAALVRLGRASFRDLRLLRIERWRAAERREQDAYAAWQRQAPEESLESANTRALDFLAARLRDSGAALIVLEAPSNPLTVPPELQPGLERFRVSLAERARREGFEFIPITRFPPIALDDFKDRVHANAGFRRRFSARLADELARSLEH